MKLASWLNFSGDFLYSLPRSSANYRQDATGSFLLASRLLFYDRSQSSLFAEAKQPHSSGGFGLEVRPVRRVRILESWMTDRMHDASRAILTEQLLLAGTVASSDRLAVTYNQQQTEALVDVTAKLTLRGGHRYVWGDARARASLVRRPEEFENGQLRRNSALAGVTWRPVQKLYFHADVEAASGDRTYFRTGLQDFQKVVGRARYQATASLAVAARFSYLNNENPER